MSITYKLQKLDQSTRTTAFRGGLEFPDNCHDTKIGGLYLCCHRDRLTHKNAVAKELIEIY